MFREKRQHLCRRQIFRIKISLPLRVLKTRRADPKFHVNSSRQESLSKIAVQAPLKKPFDASIQQSAFESNMAASSCPAQMRTVTQETCCHSNTNKKGKS